MFEHSSALKKSIKVRLGNTLEEVLGFVNAKQKNTISNWLKKNDNESENNEHKKNNLMNNTNLNNNFSSYNILSDAKNNFNSNVSFGHLSFSGPPTKQIDHKYERIKTGCTIKS